VCPFSSPASSNHLAGGGLPHNYHGESEAATPPWMVSCWMLVHSGPTLGNSIENS
jgi:hypothetical protein